MVNKLIELFSVLTFEQKKAFFKLQLLVTFTAVFEVLGVASIVPFMALVSDITIIDGNNLLATLYMYSGLDDRREYVFYIGLAVLLLLLVGGAVSIYTVWRLSLFGQKTGVSIGDRLFGYYLLKPWLYHAAGNSAQLTKQIVSESHRVTAGVIIPFMQMNSKMIMAFFLSVALLLYNPFITVVALMIFAASYLLVYRIVRRRLSINGKQVSKATEQRFRLMSEGFGGIKDVLLLGRQAGYVERFSKSGNTLSKHQGATLALVSVPRYFVEVIAFGSLIVFSLYLLRQYDSNIAHILPVMSVYAVAGLKLLPAFQQAYASIALIQGNLPAFDSIKQDLKDSHLVNLAVMGVVEQYSGELNFKDSIILSGVNFTYPNKNEHCLSALNMKICKNKTVGVVGASGSGKSTIIDLLLGLIIPSDGQILVDGVALSPDNMALWQNKIGFVPQAIFLSDASITENIAFGLAKDKIDLLKVEKVIKMAHLEQFVKTLPEGLDSRVGERGVQLSGGQRQRIGIARALYHNPEVLVLDEATSALDNTTEKLVMDAINDFSGSKTIIMIAHRLTTVEKCDVIYFMSKGKVVDFGSYEELIVKNTDFKRMANSSQ
jgi:ATP-binding cassette, subfamily B, bacterial PglK